MVVAVVHGSGPHDDALELKVKMEISTHATFGFMDRRVSLPDDGLLLIGCVFLDLDNVRGITILDVSKHAALPSGAGAIVDTFLDGLFDRYDTLAMSGEPFTLQSWLAQATDAYSPVQISEVRTILSRVEERFSNIAAVMEGTLKPFMTCYGSFKPFDVRTITRPRAAGLTEDQAKC